MHWMHTLSILRRTYATVGNGLQWPLSSEEFQHIAVEETELLNWKDHGVRGTSAENMRILFSDYTIYPSRDVVPNGLRFPQEQPLL